jgi:hypothetical protein
MYSTLELLKSMMSVSVTSSVGCTIGTPPKKAEHWQLGSPVFKMCQLKHSAYTYSLLHMCLRTHNIHFTINRCY